MTWDFINSDLEWTTYIQKQKKPKQKQREKKEKQWIETRIKILN